MNDAVGILSEFMSLSLCRMTDMYMGCPMGIDSYEWVDFADNWHRDNDLPALVWVFGAYEWYLNGRRHRDKDLPAVSLSNGTYCWYKHGKIHRDNGQPAVVQPDGSCKFYNNGISSQ